ncbi:histidine kinase, partial [Corynebacterium sp.]|uniref:sensor histidine kinase n=1 Tax=Corynebacterium sp. TaxID=1720 RepID=UPI0025C0EEE2
MDDGRFPGIGRGDVRAAAVYLVTVVVLFLSGVTNQSFLGGPQGETPWPSVVSLVLMLCGAAATVFRTSRPALLLAVVVPLSLLELLFGTQVSAYVLLVEGLWAPVARGGRASARCATVTGVVVGAVTAVAMLVGWGGEVPLGTALVFGAMVVVAVVFTPLAWGWEVRHHRLAQEAAEELARTEHALAGERAAREVESDRRHTAQDLHDVVAGHLSAVALHTNLARDLDDPAARAQSLETARDSAEAALVDLRSVIEVLAADGAGAGRQASMPASTLNWEVLRQRLGDGAVVETDPLVDDPAVVPEVVRSALLHICSEAVTNAVRHGSAPRSLRVAVHTDRVEARCGNRLPTP